MTDAPLWRGDLLVNGPTWKHTATAVAERHGLTLADLVGQQTARRFSRPRQEAMALMVSEHGLSTTRVGQLLGGRHHTTVMHALRECAKRCEKQRLSTSKSNSVDNARRALLSQCNEPAKRQTIST